VAVRIRMKKFGRKHRPFFRICVMDARRPRDGRIIEELGTYDPLVPETDARALLNGERIKYWLSVGAQPSEKVRVLIKKYGLGGTHLDAQRTALARLAQRRRRQVRESVAAAPESAESPGSESAPEEDSGQ